VNALMGITGLLFVATITPGPNNLTVMREAARAGWRAALAATIGIVAGSVTLLTLVIVGVGTAAGGRPHLAAAMAAGGGLYLSLLGGRLIAGSFPASSRLAAKIVGFVCAAGGKSSYMSVLPFANSLMLDFRAWVVPRYVYAVGADFDGQTLESPEIHSRLDLFVRDLLDGPAGFRRCSSGGSS
jgi:LysE type translocator